MSNVPTELKKRKKAVSPNPYIMGGGKSVPFEKAIHSKTHIGALMSSRRKEVVIREGHLVPPNPYLMGGSSSHMGVDTMHMTLRARFKNSSLFSRLQECKEQMQKSDEESECLFQFKDGSSEFTWKLSRTGVKFYPYVLTGGDIVLMLSVREIGSCIPNIKVEFGSLTCQKGVWQEYQMLVYWLSIYGIEVEESLVSRIDLAADIFNMDFEESSSQITDKAKRICRSTRVTYHEERYSLTGFHVGKGDIQLRVYDKSQELLKPENGHKLDFFYDLWSLPVGTPVTRFEFQLRGGVLKEIFKYKNVKTVLEHIPNVWSYLTYDWCRLTAKPVDRENKNHQRSRISFIWSMVQYAGTSIIYTPTKRVRTNKPLANVTQLVKQLSGLALSIAASRGDSVITYEKLYHYCTEALHEGLSYQTTDMLEMYKKFRLKQSKFFSPMYEYVKPLVGCVNLQAVPF